MHAKLRDMASVLGIESSCDETGVSLVRGGELVAHALASSMEEHARYGGIIPEVASRAHLNSVIPVLEECLSQTDTGTSEIDAIAVVAGPGLVGSLGVGVCAAKALAFALDRPIYAVNHILAHLAVDRLEHGDFPSSFIGLVVSGGHSSLVHVRDIASDVEELGGTLDDAAGEAFDKVGRLLGLPYPGGPHVDKLAKDGNKEAIVFPRGLAAGKYRHTHPYDFSFSGLKTAVARYIEGAQLREQKINPADIAAGFSESVVDSLVTKALRACEDYNVETIVVGGGFSANSHLRAMLAERMESRGITVRIPSPYLCTDNGAMAGALGWELARAGIAPSPPNFSVHSSLPLSVPCLSGESNV